MLTNVDFTAEKLIITANVVKFYKIIQALLITTEGFK